MRAYSNDLRERIVVAVERGDYPLRQLAHLFSVSLAFLVRLLQRKRRTGSVDPSLTLVGRRQSSTTPPARPGRQQAGGRSEARRRRPRTLVRLGPPATRRHPGRTPRATWRLV